MKKYITNLYGHSVQSTAMLAQQMIYNQARELGYEEIAVRGHDINQDSSDERLKRIEGMLSGVESGGLIIAQMPSWNGIIFDEVFLSRLRERAGRLVIFIHDFVPLMFVSNRYLMERYLKVYNIADLVILPSEKMEVLLRGEGLTVPVMYQTIWDHVTNIEDLPVPSFERVFKFAGNTTRFPFVKDWQEDIPLEVFSRGDFEGHSTLKLRGWMHDDALLRSLSQGGFGLVWSEDIETQAEREYSEMNVSFKFSTYLAAGLPLIVNKGLAREEFVKANGLGFAVDNLEEAVKLVSSMDEQTYRRVQANVASVSGLVREGFFAKKLLLDIQYFLYLGEKHDNL